MAGKSLEIADRRRCSAVVDHPAVTRMLPEFTGALEAATLELFDAVLPNPDLMVDIDAHVGLPPRKARATVRPGPPSSPIPIRWV